MTPKIRIPVSRTRKSWKMMAAQRKCNRFVLLALLSVTGQLSAQEWEKNRQFNAPEAYQAAAADHDFVYAITNDQVAKYDRELGHPTKVVQAANIR